MLNFYGIIIRGIKYVGGRQHFLSYHSGTNHSING